nr:hypothetical protein [uncultured Flavobacterium sp.]
MTTIFITLGLIITYFVISAIKEGQTKEIIEKERQVNNQKLADLQYSINKKKLPKKANIEIYVRDETLIQNDPIRYMTGYPGENSRVLTKSYYSLFYSNKKDSSTALEFLKYRCDAFNSIVGAPLDRKIIERASEEHFNSVTQLIFFISYHESHYGNSEIFDENIVRKVYNVIQEEHNKVCPSGQEEISEFNLDFLFKIKDTYSFLLAPSKIENKAESDICIKDDNEKIDLKTLEFQFNLISRIIENNMDFKFQKDKFNYRLNESNKKDMNEELIEECKIASNILNKVADKINSGLDEKEALLEEKTFLKGKIDEMTIDIDDEIDNDINDYFNSKNDIDDIDNFDDIETNRKEIIKTIEIIGNAMEEMLKTYMPENPMKNTPLEGVGLISHLRLISDVVKDQLILDKIELGLNDRDIEYIISMSYKNVYLKYFED